MKEKIEQLLKIAKDYKLLYVEDNIVARESTSIFLKRLFVNITTAVDGQDGLEKFLSKKDFNLIITDINMPNMDGLDMIKEIRSVDSKIKIIILSAHNEQHYFDKAVELNVTEYLTKPTAFPKLVGKLHKVLETKEIA